MPTKFFMLMGTIRYRHTDKVKFVVLRGGAELAKALRTFGYEAKVRRSDAKTTCQQVLVLLGEDMSVQGLLELSARLLYDLTPEFGYYNNRSSFAPGNQGC